MNRKELERYVGVTGRTLGQVEKDYLQHIILASLSRKAAGVLVFKGGTALQKTGISDRFSEDLDFTARGKVTAETLREVALESIRTYNFPVSANTLIDNAQTASLRIKSEGPLASKGRGVCTIRIEVSKREPVILDPDRREFGPPYPDVIPYVLDVMQNEEMLAEKVRALLGRQKARDLYDIYWLIERRTGFDRRLVAKKLSLGHIDFERERFLRACKRLEPDWERELKQLVERIIPFDVVMDRVDGAM